MVAFSKTTPLPPPRHPRRCWDRCVRGRIQRAATIAVTGMTPALNPAQRRASRATLGFRSSSRAGRPRRSATFRLRAQLSRLGLRSHQERLGRPTRTYVGMRGPARRQERLNPRHGLPDGSGQHSRPPWIGWMAQNGPDVMGFRLFRFLPPKVRSGGPGEPLGGSVRPRGRSLQPTRAWTAPTAMHAILRGGEGVLSYYIYIGHPTNPVRSFLGVVLQCGLNGITFRYRSQRHFSIF